MATIKKENNPCVDCVSIIDKVEKINELGCSFFLDANESHKTIMISSEIRWLTVKSEGKRLLNTQQRANAYIERVTQKYEPHTPKINMQILLGTNPKKIKNNQHIVQLIKAGVDIRYKKMSNTLKMCHRENTLFISYAPEPGKTANTGIKYVSKYSDDPVIKRHTARFETDFKNAKRVTIGKDEKLTFSDKFYKLWLKAIKEIEKKDIIIAIISAVLGGLITFSIK